MRKIIWALPLATALAMAVGVPSESADSTTTSIYGTTRYEPSTDTQLSYVAPMHAGDCSMFGNLYVSRPNSAGFANVRFYFTTSTSHTNNFDQWHNSWKFYDSFGQPVDASGTIAVGTIDGLRMPRVNVNYVGEIDTTIKMNGNQWDNIKNVLWTGAC